jgi:hypothetical protein
MTLSYLETHKTLSYLHRDPHDPVLLTETHTTRFWQLNYLFSMNSPTPGWKICLYLTEFSIVGHYYFLSVS